MANFPPLLPVDRNPKLVQLVLNLTDIQLRDNALFQISKLDLVEFYEDLPPIVWFSFGTVAALLQEIVSVYRKLSPKELKLEQSTRVNHALLIFQGLASHPETRMLFLNANMPCYLYPFLDIPPTKSSPLEDLRIASLSVVCAFMKIATLILLRLLRDNSGLDYICTTMVRLSAVANVLKNTLTVLAGSPSPILLGEQQGILLMHTIRCYFQLSQNSRACAVLPSFLPNMLRDGTFSNFFRDNPQPRLFLEQLLQKVYGMSRLVRQGGVGYNHMPMK